ncbi:hypothetical protein [Halorussus salinisoli]|uniref:hypothetical protein n=1 Tax=Halorussus salinisoli TaxID=2558242 RepID=UPI0010C20D3E|nr:hypothetical protein [Halorussus salinisoli]
MHASLHWPLPALHSFTPAFESLGLAIHWLTLGLVLLATLAVGVCVHELLHVVPLHLTDASYTVTVLPAEEPTSRTTWATLQHAFSSGLVRVEVTHLRPTTPDWMVRVAALLPLALALPLGLVVAGVLPNPVTTGDDVVTVALVALTGCGLPSPADWSVVWNGASRWRDQ